MRFPCYFRRSKGAGPYPALGSDTKPTAATPARRQVGAEINILSHKLVRPVKRIAVGYWYEGAGPAVTLPCTVYVFDDSSQKWYQTDTGTLTSGVVSYFKCAVLQNPPLTFGGGAPNSPVPDMGMDVMIVVEDNVSPSPDGLITVVAGPDMADW